MKFRITSKDLIIFVIFCLFLLYLCAISVLNFINFGAEGRLWGLNPIPAFSGVYLPITLLLFFLALIMIFSSVSSYVFEREKKGLGIIVKEKEEKGYSSWAKDKDIKLPLLLIFLILFMSSLFSMSYNSISYCLSLSLGYCLYHNHILNQNFQRSEYGEIKSYNSCLRNL